MNYSKKKASLTVFIMIALVTVFVSGDEGMWLFNIPPIGILETKHEFKPTPEWLTHIRLSSIKFGGASASFVSPDGLVLTNHHVGRSTIQNLSSKEKDLMKTGFYARTKAEELKCPGLELSVLQGIEDVTPRVQDADNLVHTLAEAAGEREKMIAVLEKEYSEKTGLKCRVINLYSGGLYHIYKYKVYTDIRLVFAPEYTIAKFGGDPDNFMFPRYALDICFFRVYENDRPLETTHFLKWAADDLNEGDLVFLSGNPGSTGRLLTHAQMEFLSDVSYPFSIKNYQRRRALMKDFSKKGSEETRVALTALFGIENSLKATLGYQSGLLDKNLMERKAQEENDLRKAVENNPGLQKECGKAWVEIAEAQIKYRAFFKALQFFEKGLAFNTVYFSHARNLVRIAQEKRKPNGDRLNEFRDTHLDSMIRSLLSPIPVYDDFEIVKLADSLAQLKEELGEYPVVKAMLGIKSPEEVALELISGTTLKDLEERKSLLEGGMGAISQSTDPMIKLALLLDPLARDLRTRYETEVEAVENLSGALIAKALFNLKGTSIPPDATSTLRLGFGIVKGYVENGKKIPFFTTFAGLYKRSRKFEAKAPFDLPQSFLKRKSALDLNVPLNFAATCDSIGGNSGSPVINKNGEFVGVLFDGNIQSLPARFLYSDEQNRSVMVHCQGIIEALLKVYDAKPLVNEIQRR